VKKERLAKIEKAFDDAAKAGNVKWMPSMPIGQRFESVFVKRDQHRSEAYQYDAMIPLGALTPTAPQADPNSVNTFWMKRSGGLMGTSMYAGPFTIS
jgi:hypothetical protein